MLTITGTGRLTRSPELRHTTSDKKVATVSVASDRRNRSDKPIYVDLVLWEAQAEAAVKHLVKGQQITFAGRFEPRTYETRDGQNGIALEVVNVDIEYGAKPRGATAPGAVERVPEAAQINATVRPADGRAATEAERRPVDTMTRPGETITMGAPARCEDCDRMPKLDIYMSAAG